MKKILFAFLVSLVSFFSFAATSQAKMIVQEKGTITVTAKEVINDDLFIAGENVEILGTVNGDVYVGAGMVKVDGKINGDLLVGGGNVTVSGKIQDDVYIGGGNVIVQAATIGDSLLVGAGTLNIDKNSTIGGSLLTGVGMLDVSAKIGRSLYAGAGEIKMGETAKVDKDFYYTLGDDKTEFAVPKGAVVAGTVQRIQNTVKVEAPKVDFAKGFYAMRIISFLGALLVGILAIKYFSGKIEEVVNITTSSVFSNLGIGFLILILTVPVAFLVMFTGIGASLSMIVLALYGVAVYMAKLVSALALGSVISKQVGNKLNVYLSFGLGLIVLFGFKFIPVIGGLTSFVFTCVGLGAIYKLIKH